MKCKYNVGPGVEHDEHAVVGEKYCTHHLGARCVSCHAQATHNCQNQVENVCGCPLCANCEHVEIEGRNGQFWQHRVVGGEMQIPHYAKEVVKK